MNRLNLQSYIYAPKLLLHNLVPLLLSTAIISVELKVVIESVVVMCINTSVIEFPVISPYILDVMFLSGDTGVALIYYFFIFKSGHY